MGWLILAVLWEGEAVRRVCNPLSPVVTLTNSGNYTLLGGRGLRAALVTEKGVLTRPRALHNPPQSPAQTERGQSHTLRAPPVHAECQNEIMECPEPLEQVFPREKKLCQDVSFWPVYSYLPWWTVHLVLNRLQFLWQFEKNVCHLGFSISKSRAYSNKNQEGAEQHQLLVCSVTVAVAVVEESELVC